tara:strand:- start:4328 stop:5482 length:1155 start_codon:yes stop_codon:yes gene_type:complete
MPYLGKQLGFTNLAGDELFLDADSDSSIIASTDDQIDIKTGGTDAVTIDSSQNAIFANDVKLQSDSCVLSFGANDEIRLTHNHDKGLILSNTNTGDDKPVKLALHTGETDMAADDVLGVIEFQAPSEASGSDATLLAAAVRARSEGDFSSGSNATSLDFMTGSSENASTRATVRSNGQFFVGATADIGGHTITQKRTGAGGCLYLECNATSGVQSFLDIVNAANNGTSQGVRFHTNGYGNIRGTISWDNSSTSYNTSSDYRLKENVVTDWNATTRLKQLKPCRFNFIEDADNTIEGFLAHEVSSIVPQAVTGEKDGTQDIGRIEDENGNIKAENVLESTKENEEHTWTKTATENVYQQIDHSKLVPLLVKTIQELEARITALES